MNKYTVLVMIVFFSACATATHRGVIAMKLNDEEAHVGMGAKELSVGDHVEIYKHICTGNSKIVERTCKHGDSGHGVVLQIINDNYSLVKFDSGVKFSEGDTVEKHSHK